MTRAAEFEPFKLERYFARYEFSTRYLLSSSDCESLTLRELLDLADDDGRERWERLGLGYTESQGDPALREAISRQYASVGPEGVLVLVPEEGIYILMRTLLSPGDHAVVMQPAYQSLYSLARAAGAEVSPWRLRPNASGAWALDLDELERLINPRTRLLVVNFPHNPTGYHAAREMQAAIVDVARRHGLYLFGDEMYRGLEYAPGEQLPPTCDVYERGISLSGLSKGYALPGLRLGWLATRDAGLLEQWQAYKDYTTICHSAPSEVLGLIALRAAEPILARSLGIVQANLALAGKFFTRHAGRFTWLPPRAGSVAFPAFHGDVEAWCRGLLDQRGVMVVPGSLFDTPGPHFRIGLGRRSFAAVLGEVEAFLEAGG